MNFNNNNNNNNNNSPTPAATPEPKKNHTKTIAVVAIVGFLAVFGGIGLYHEAQETLNNIAGTSSSSVSSDIRSGEYDSYIKQKCFTMLNELGFSPVEDSINQCMYKAKEMADQELNK
jgi:hypothetical protein